MKEKSKTMTADCHFKNFGGYLAIAWDNSSDCRTDSKGVVIHSTWKDLTLIHDYAMFLTEEEAERWCSKFGGLNTSIRVVKLL